MSLVEARGSVYICEALAGTNSTTDDIRVEHFPF
jgi:hypothetical protein